MAAAAGRIVSVSADGAARLWHIGAENDSRLLNWKAYGIRDAAFTPDGTTIIAAGDDNCLHLLDLRSDTERVIEGHSDWVSRIAANPERPLCGVGFG